MKIFIQIPQLIFGGAEKVLVSFANELVNRGHEVELLETYEKGLLKPQFDSRVRFRAICSREYSQKYYASLSDIKGEHRFYVKVKKICKLAFSKIVGYRKYAEKLAAKYYKDKSYDVAINYLEIESPRFILDSISAKKYIQWYHTDVANIDDPENTDIMVPYYERMDAVICVSESSKLSFTERYPQLADKTHVIYNFFDVEAIKKAAEEPFKYRNRIEGVPVFLSVGRMTPQKKYLRFLNVLHRLKTEGVKFQWYVLGDGFEREAIEKKIIELDLSNEVFLEGLTDNPYKYMKKCDLFVLPSGWEGFPTVTVEAKILGCAVLATDVSGIREQIVHGKTGLIVGNNEDCIFIGLKSVLENPAKLNEMRNSFINNNIINNDLKYKHFLKLID